MPNFLAFLFALLIWGTANGQLIFNEDSDMRYEMAYTNYSTINRYGVTKRGEYIAFKPYTGQIASKNMLTFLKPQAIVNIYGKVKDQPFYYVEYEGVKGFFKDYAISFIDEEQVSLLKLKDTIYLKKPLIINDVIYPPATELKIERFEKGNYIALIWDDGLYRAKIKKNMPSKKPKGT